MPVHYPAGIVQEHLTVRNSVGAFDVSHMGEFEVGGKDALNFLQRVTINDVSKLDEGRVQYTAMCYDDGGIVDDLLLYNLGDRFLMVVNASNREKDLRWLQDQMEGEVELEDVSEETGLLAVQGPKSLQTLNPILNDDLNDLQYYWSKRTMIADIPIFISRTGYTGELGFELYFKVNRSNADILWDAVFDSGKKFGIMPIGLGARDTLRLEMGFCLYGNDIDQTTNPLEAGLGWITKLQKGDFIGKEAILSSKAKGLKKKLVGFTLNEKNVPRHGYSILADGSKVGHVTSGTFSPTLQQGIGMGYISTEYVQLGKRILIDVRGKQVEAAIVEPPFIQKS